MDRNLIKHHLEQVSNAVISFDELLKTIKQSICVIIGNMEADDIDFDFGNMTYPTKSGLMTINNIDGNGYQKSISNNLIKEIKEMIFELKIKGFIRQRANGLIELRTKDFGSIYGRTRDEIETKLTERFKEVNKEKKNKKTAPLLSEFYKDNYLPYKLNQNRAENTMKGIESNFKYIMAQGFDKPLTAYKSQEIESFLYGIEKTRKRQVVQGLLNNMFDRALTLSLIKANPCAPIEKMQHTQEQGTALSFDEQVDFFASLFASNALSYREKCYFIFIYLTGSRREEALKINKSDVDLKNKVLAIHGDKTESSDRCIPLVNRVATLLSTLPTENGDYFGLSYDNVGRKFREVYSKHKIHDLRHTFGTIQICVEKINPKTVSLWLGHTTIDTTLRIYTHPEQLDKGTFLRGDLTEDEKNTAYRTKYQEVLQLIDSFLDDCTTKRTTK
ncbi:MAG: site-specific integrase [Clostridiales bacterium]|nr:site-specific integrase [Clostridiales bacterium]